MQVDAESTCGQLLDESLSIELLVFQHAVSDVYDPGMYPILFQVGADADKADGIHFENGCRWDHIAYGAIHYRMFPEIVVARSMQ